MTVGLLALILSLAACGFGGSQATDDEADDADVPGDAGDDPADDSDVPPGPCSAVETTCANEVTLRECTMVGAEPVDTPCAWGCVPMPAAHCGELVPTADGAGKDDVAAGGFAGVQDVEIPSGAVVDGDDPGTITGVDPSDFEALVRGDGAHVRVFKARSFVFEGDVSLVGARSIQFVADEQITVRGVISAVGPCTTNDDAIRPGPGGYEGGLDNNAGHGPVGIGGGGGGESTSNRGGGGGGNGAPGGSGGNASGVSNGGGAHSPTITMLVGGSGGGAGGGGGGYGRGGGGGGAVHLISNTGIVFEASGGIDAGGCGGDGDSGGGADGGGGGGAGGTIVLEAPVVTGFGDLAANGGGGGSGGNAGGAGKGMNGQRSRTAAAGQPGNPSPGSDGGPGGVALVLQGGSAMDAPGDAGGGGGGIGRIHFSTRAGRSTVTLGGVHSPALDDMPSTATAVDARVE